MKLSTYTLELILLFSGIALLGGIVVFGSNIHQQLSSLQKSRQLTEMNSLKEVLEAYYLEQFQYPDGISGVPLEICDTGDETKTSTDSQCEGFVDLRSIVPEYTSAIPHSGLSDAVQTGYYVWISEETGRINLSRGLE